MIKRFLSKALLSVLLEKDVRDRVLGVETGPTKRPGDGEPLPESLLRPPSPRAEKRKLRQPGKQASDALGRARADLDHPPPKRPDDATERAARDPKTSASDQPAREPGKIDREALIAEAMAIQQRQSKKLDDLPLEDKLKLHLLARVALLGEDIFKK